MAIRSSWYRRKSVSTFLQLIERPKGLFMKMSYDFIQKSLFSFSFWDSCLTNGFLLGKAAVIKAIYPEFPLLK